VTKVVPLVTGHKKKSVNGHFYRVKCVMTGYDFPKGQTIGPC